MYHRPPDSDRQFREEVFPAELDYVAARWRELHMRRDHGDSSERRRLAGCLPTVENQLVGLALSGGGRRSATFNVGLLQALHRHGVFDHVDYLSTVSGGTYLGASLSCLMRSGEEFPFEGAPRESVFVRWMRYHGNLLGGGGLLGLFSGFAAVLRGILLNFLIFVPLLLLGAISLDWYWGGVPGPWGKGILTEWEVRHELLAELQEEVADGHVATPAELGVLEEGVRFSDAYRFTPWLAALALVFFVAHPVVIRVFATLNQGARSEGASESSVQLRAVYGLWFGRLLLMIPVVFGLESMPILVHLFHFELRHWSLTGALEATSIEKISGVLQVLAALAGTVLGAAGLGRLASQARWRASRILFTLAGAAVATILPLLVVLWISEALVYEWRAGLAFSHEGWWLFAIIIGLILAGLLGSLTARVVGMGLHWRPRLMAVSLASLSGMLAPMLMLALVRRETELSDKELGALWLIVAGLAALAAAGFADWLWDRFDPARTRRPGLRRMLTAAAGVSSGFAWLLWLDLSIPRDASVDPAWLVLILAAILWLFNWALVDVNVTSVSGLYRDRLAATYLVGLDRNLVRRETPLGEIGLSSIDIEEDLDLQEICQEGSIAPYHLINVAINLQGSIDPKARTRYSDSFILSKHFCGGPQTGYASTGPIEAVFPQLDLATAMAISSAAVGPGAGKAVGSSMLVLMTILNARLGYWIPNPRWLRAWAQNLPEPTRHTLARRFAWRVPPRAFFRELLGALDEEGRWVNLSDGGHFENTGGYELLRRRCKFIIMSDAEADPEHQFSGLANLIRYAWIDLQTKIEIDVEGLKKRRDGHSEMHAAYGRIHYPPAARDKEPETGRLLYVKCSMTGDEALEISQYHARHPTFPHQSTTDQDFDEHQFVAYQALGRHVGESLFWNRDSSGRLDFDGFSQWFGELERGLAPSRKTDATLADRIHDLMEMVGRRGTATDRPL